MNRRRRLDEIQSEYGILAVYVFGSRADDGLRLFAGEPVPEGASDLDVGVVFVSDDPSPTHLSEIQTAMEELFAPLRVDLVPLQRVDPIFQFRAIDGHRLGVLNSCRADFFELGVMRQAAELLPVQRQLERDLFGVATT